MKKAKLCFLTAVAALMLVITNMAFAQDSQAPATDKDAQGTSVQQVVKEEAPQAAKDLSIYGEVQSVNAAANSIIVQYYDYDSDEEKTSDILADKDTKIENASGIADIKKGDWVDVTYVALDGKNTAKSIIVEKEEIAPGSASSETSAAASAPASQ